MTDNVGAVSDNKFSIIKKGSLVVSGIAVFLMMIFIVAEVILRNIFSMSISGNYEILENYLMPLAVFPVIAITYSSGLMPKITMLVDKFTGKAQYIINLFLLLLELLVMGLIFYLTLDYAIQGLHDGAAFPAGGKMYPLYPVYFLVPLGFGLFIIEIIFNIIYEIKQRSLKLISSD